MSKKYLVFIMVFFMFLSFNKTVNGFDDKVRIGLFFGDNARSSIIIKPEDSMCLEYFNGSEYIKIMEMNKKVSINKDGRNRILVNDYSNNELYNTLIDDKSNHLRLRPTGEKEILYLNNKPYRGNIITSILCQNGLTVINQVNIEDYLYGVVSKEMPYNWDIEALKAQAVAARTYLLRNLGRYGQRGFDLTDNVYTQAYGGVNSENSLARRAVDETKGEVILYNNKLINAFYHSCSGGYTELSENVWSHRLPYINSFYDKYSLNSPYNRWEVSFTKEDTKEILRKNGYNVNTIESFSINSKYLSNRPKEIEVNTDAGKIIFEKQEIRWMLGLRSMLFKIKSNVDIFLENDISKFKRQGIQGKKIITNNGTSNINNNYDSKLISSTGMINISNELKEYKFVGSGFGHGVGMSQWGAKNKADLGYTYDEIIKYYYNGTEIGSI